MLRVPRPSVSVICLYSIVASLAEAGRECRTGQHPEMQAELERAERRLDEHILANSEFTPAQIERFKAGQRRPANQDICQMVGPPYDGFAAVGPERFRSDLDWILANRRSIDEGDCL